VHLWSSQRRDFTSAVNAKLEKALLKAGRLFMNDAGEGQPMFQSYNQVRLDQPKNISDE
jgi:hypothetical protein